MNAVDAIGGELPVRTPEFARRAYDHALDPGRNPVKRVMDNSESVRATPPLLGIFNDIPWHKLREDEAHAWASAGFSWIVNDAEHSQWEGWYGRQQNAALLRLGLLPVQRLHREAISQHGDVFQMGARAAMKPYGTSLEDARRFLKSVSFPVPGKATGDDRGGYPTRGGDRSMRFTPDSLRESETDTQGWVQFETSEYILNTDLRDAVLDLMAAQGPNRDCCFVGPFDAILREGEIPAMEDGINELFEAATRRGVHSGRVVGSGSMDDPQAIEEAMVFAINHGARLISVHVMTSDLPYRGAERVASPFFRAARRCGF